MADPLGLADPADYAAPTNGPAGALSAPSQPEQSAPAASAPAAQAEGQSQAPEITPFPPAPPTVTGAQATFNVYQGPA